MSTKSTKKNKRNEELFPRKIPTTKQWFVAATNEACEEMDEMFTPLLGKMIED